jgi:hypothetical protein
MIRDVKKLSCSSSQLQVLVWTSGWQLTGKISRFSEDGYVKQRILYAEGKGKLDPVRN